MIRPDFLQDLNARAPEELRQVIAHAAGIHAHHDGDGGAAIALALHRIADRLTGQPRKAAA